MTKDGDGFTWIDMPQSNIGFRGVVYDDGPSIVLDGSSAHERPFGCYREQFDVQEELEPEASRECIEQPLVMTLDDRGGTWSGKLTFAIYKKRLAPGRPSGSAIPPPMQAAPGWTVNRTTWLVEIGPASRVGEAPAKL